VVWTSNSANLPITPQGLATGAVVGPATVTASWSSGVVKGTINATVTAAALASIAVTPASISVGIGAQQQYKAMATYADNNTADITNQVTWTSDNPAVVGITTGGFATAFGTSTLAIHITASLGAVTSPAAFFSADPTLARVCPDASIDMKVLVVTNGKTEADYPAITQILDYVGTPYDVFDTTVTPSGFTASMLSDGVCHGYYQGVIMTLGGNIYTVPGMDLLTSYEKTFKVRQVNWFTFPGSDYGFGAALTTTTPEPM